MPHPFGPLDRRRRPTASTFTFRLEHRDGTAADPPRFATTLLNWKPGDSIYLGSRTLRVIETRPGDEEADPVLVVEDTAEPDAA